MGLIEVEGVAGIIVAADAACKAASVRLLGWESIGGFTTVFFGGEVGDVAISLRQGERAARDIVDHVVAAALNRPEEVTARQIEFPLHGPSPERETALGLVETRGYGAHVDANDRMVKAADVEVSRVLTVHNRVVCTLIEGAVGSVREALEVGRQRLAAYEHFLCSTVIPQPAPEVLHLFSPRN